MGRKLTLVTDNNSPGAKRRKIAKRKRNVRRFVTVGAMGLFLGMLFSVTYTDRQDKLREAERQLAAYEEQYEQLQTQEEYYRQEISKLENEDYIARLARERYFKSEEGEITFKLPKSPSDSRVESDEEEATQESINEK